MMTNIYSLKCPITHEIPDPNDFVIGSDNIVYSKKAILIWLNTSKISPVTKIDMTENDLRVCPVIKRIIEEIYYKPEIVISGSTTITKSTMIDIDYEKAKINN